MTKENATEGKTHHVSKPHAPGKNTKRHTRAHDHPGRAPMPRHGRAHGNPRYHKGYRLERDIVTYLRDHGHAAIRTPASKTVDVIAWTPRHAHTVIECKAHATDTLYIPRDDLHRLTTFAKAFHATPLIAWRPSHRRIHTHGYPKNIILIHPRHLTHHDRTASITLRHALQHGHPLTDLLTPPDTKNKHVSESRAVRENKDGP